MEALLTNKILVIKNPSPQVVAQVDSILSYEDKSKRYLLRRKMKQPMFKFTPEYEQLKQEVHGKMYKVMPGGHLAMSSGFAFLCNTFKIPVIDQRTETGDNIALPWINKPFDPRPYQAEAIDEMENNYRGVINFATGLGKTLTAIHAVRRIGKKTLIVVPSESIAMQFLNELRECFGKNRVELFSGKRKKMADITVGIAASVVKAADKFKEHGVGMVIFDEVHHIAATTFFDIARALGDVGKMFGLTATDFRSDGKDIMITAGCGHVLIKRDLIWGIQNGWLAEPEFVVREVDTKEMKQYKGDKLKNYRAHVLNNEAMNNQIEHDIQKELNAGSSVLILVDQVAHGEAIAKKFGIPFATGNDKKSQDYVDQLNEGSIPGLVGTDGKVGEGTDTKNVDALFMVNFVAGKGPVYQCIGRGTRKHGSKTSVRIYDYIPLGSDMLKRHALTRIKYYNEINAKKVTVC